MTGGMLLRALPTLVRVSVARHVAYRAEMTIWILTATLPLIMLALWTSVVAGQDIAGFGEAEVARYFVATLIVRQITGAWIVWELSWSIRQGSLSPHLLRPFHPLIQWAVWVLVAIPFRLAVLFPVVALLAAWRPELVALPSAVQAAQFGLAVALAWVLSYLVQCAFGLLAFWLDKSDGLYDMWLAVWGILSGYVVPIAFFPPLAREVLGWLPFRAMLGLPVELLGGFLSPEEAWPALALSAAWTGVAWVVVAVLWRRGLVRYGAFGA